MPSTTKSNRGLVQALRQCDGGRVQCLLMVRDDFWMAVTRFLNEVEAELVQGHNFATVDLFPVRHAEKVLAAFGQAFDALPSDPNQTSTAQQRFLTEAVAGLAEDGQVICVRLALFAEMVKAKEWTPDTLRAVGGTEGVGITFLEETFETHPNPKHKFHQKAARAVLKALLPESGTDIKGHMRSYEHLLNASGYAHRPRDFAELMRILNSEIRLITPTEADGDNADDQSPQLPEEGKSYYQLTHDYLVPALRDWLTRKQRETRRGRAQIRLEELTAAWKAKPERRHLPGVFEWLNICCLRPRKSWSAPQKQMMRAATGQHLLKLGVLSVILAALNLAAREWQAYVQARAIVEQLEVETNAKTIHNLILQLTPVRHHADRMLKQMGDETLPGSEERLKRSLALLPVDADHYLEEIYEAIFTATPKYLQIITSGGWPGE